MDPSTVQTILAGVILAAVLWLARSVTEYGNTLAKLQTVLTGVDGSNGLNGKVKTLDARTEEHEREIGKIQGRHDLLDQRVGTIEERMA